MEAKIYNTIEKSFIKEWMNLWYESKSACYVNGPQWFLSVIECFNYKDFAIITVYENNKLIGVAALIKEKLYGVEAYTIPPGDFVCGIPFLTKNTNKELMKILVKKLSTLGVIILDNVPDFFIVYLKEESPSSVYLPRALNFYLNLKKDVNGQIIVHGRKKLIKEAKKIEDRFEIKSYTGKDKHALELAFKIDKKSKKQKKGYNAFSDKLSRKLYERLAYNFGENLLISILFFDKKPVVYEIGFLVKDVYTGSQVAYDQKYNQYTPGKVSELKVIDLMASKGVQCVDYGSGDSYIKRLISEEYRNLYRIIISKNALIKLYLQIVFNGKDYVYNLLNKKKLVYFLYRKVTKTLSTINKKRI